LAWIEDWLANKQVVGKSGSFSGWQHVTSVVPQGSVLVPQLNYLDERTIRMVAKFADDTKVSRKVNCEEAVRRLQGENLANGI